MTTDHPAAPTAEKRRAALVERMAAAMRATREFAAGAAFGVPSDAHVQYSAGLAEAVLVLLESGGWQCRVRRRPGRAPAEGNALTLTEQVVDRAARCRSEHDGLLAELESVRALLRESDKPLLPDDWWARVRAASRS